jgi:hypothetical protein
LKSIIDVVDIPLEGPIYEGINNAKLSLEIRDFGTPNRTLVVRYWAEGHPMTAMVSWEKFTDAFDAMRARMLSGDWDEALTQMLGRNDSL